MLVKLSCCLRVESVKQLKCSKQENYHQMSFVSWQIITYSKQVARRQLHDEVILLQLPESFSSSFSCAHLIGLLSFKSQRDWANLNKKAKTKWILVVVVKCCHRERSLLFVATQNSWFKYITCLTVWPMFRSIKRLSLSWFYRWHFKS